jgi:hypothetical protein
VYAHLTFQPVGSGGPETVTVDLPADLIAEMRALIGTPQVRASEAAAWVLCQAEPNGPMKPYLFRLARITAIDPLTDPGAAP